ncbi:gag protein [Lasius niger]|uniref:Gag protein n=1 Tax=Lasius niger TaxID=67767 RepID=A0A0J7MXX2_LASNI|nr:gag protein [Lasius niger]
MTAVSVDSFLERMRTITQGTAEVEKRSTPSHQQSKAKDSTCRNCGKKGHGHKDCKSELNCFYCKEKGHRRYDCPALKKKETKTTVKASGSPIVAAASVISGSEDLGEVAAVDETGSR